MLRHIFLAALAALQASAPAPNQRPVDRLPGTFLWAWERPTDLTRLPPDVGVAYLAGTLTLSGGGVISRPRAQPLKLEPTTVVLAVVRIVIAAQPSPTLTEEQQERAAAAALQLARRPRVAGLQIDFDATPRQRTFYAGVLRRLRRAMPAAWPLSITALASWCLGDPWIAGLPIDEAVPMLFQMGPGSGDIRRRVEAGEEFSVPACRMSVGLSLDEMVARWPAGRRRYLFSPRGWSPAAVAQALGHRNQPGSDFR